MKTRNLRAWQPTEQMLRHVNKIYQAQQMVEKALGEN